MRSVVINFFRLEVLNIHPAVYWGLAVIWLLLLASAYASVRSLPISGVAKFIWLLVIFAIPGIGLTVYALRCLLRANWEILKPWFQSRRVERQLSGRRLAVDPAAKARTILSP